ncbi:hypothetical protein LSAT2_021866 [Lamellibrachia satsuma]|nr:hypothetical protein LSAT2_021866 [Lamellibrachia satsuma]
MLLTPRWQGDLEAPCVAVTRGWIEHTSTLSNSSMKTILRFLVVLAVVTHKNKQKHNDNQHEAVSDRPVTIARHRSPSEASLPPEYIERTPSVTAVNMAADAMMSEEEKTRLEQEKAERRAANRNCCMKALKFLFSNIGLSAMVVLYTVAGGFIFEHLEKSPPPVSTTRIKPRLHHPSPPPVSSTRLHHPSPLPVSHPRLQQPSPLPVSNPRLHHPSPPPVSNLRLHHPSPPSVSNLRLQQPSPPPVSNPRFHHPSPPPVSNPRLHHPSPPPVSNPRLQQPSPLPVSNPRLHHPSPPPVSNLRLHHPSPPSVSNLRLHQPSPLPISNPRLRHPSPPPVSTTRIKPPFPPPVSTTCIKPPSPPPVSTTRIKPPSPPPVSTIRIKPPSPSAVSTTRIKPPSPPPVSTIRIKPLSLPPVSTTRIKPPSPSAVSTSRIKPPSPSAVSSTRLHSTTTSSTSLNVGVTTVLFIDQTNEYEECNKAREKYEPAENDTVWKLWDIAASFRNDDDREYAMTEYQKIIVTFRDNVLGLGYDGKNCSAMDDPDGPGYQWNFAGALLFSVTVITTIGEY